MTKLPSILSGVAGVYYVAAELSRRGLIASTTSRNTRGIDVLVSSQDASRQVGVQVKTSQGDGRKWLLVEHAERYFADNLFYVFVDLKDEGSRDYFVVPSRVVAEFIRDAHQQWINAPGRGGRQRKDSSMRVFRDPDGKFLEQWQTLGLPLNGETR